MEHQRPRYTALHPEGSYNETKNMLNRLLMDSAADEAFVLESIRDKVDPETLAEVRRALDNIAARSRHIGQHLVEHRAEVVECEVTTEVDQRPRR